MFNTRWAIVGQNINIFLSQNRLCDVIAYKISKNNKNFYNYFGFTEQKTSYTTILLFCVQCIGS